MDNFIGYREVINTKKNLIIINSYPRSGKDTFANFLIKHLDNYNICGALVSSVEVVKECATLMGWDGNKTEYNRDMLSSLKDWSSEWLDHPFKMMCDNADSLKPEEAIIYMIREPNEISRFKERYPETITIFIERDQHETANNHADQNVNDFNYDLRVENNRTLEQLEESAKQLVHNLFNKGE
ncbi:MAG: hypothetical protein WC055_00565 [Melioribacteraceae bacterium]